MRLRGLQVGTPAAPLAYGLMMRRGGTVLRLQPPGAAGAALQLLFMNI